MRTNMDPLTPTTSTLSPAIAHIAETAASLAESMKERIVHVPEDEAGVKRQRQRETVRWVLDAPSRLKGLVEGERREEAMEDWEEVQRLLEKWKGVQGADEVKQQCSSIMSKEILNDAG
ncbi:MAG: hypothetical protein Q9223_004522 [Gallowayella weberi]